MQTLCAPLTCGWSVLVRRRHYSMNFCNPGIICGSHSLAQRLNCFHWRCLILQEFHEGPRNFYASNFAAALAGWLLSVMSVARSYAQKLAHSFSRLVYSLGSFPLERIVHSWHVPRWNLSTQELLVSAGAIWSTCTSLTDNHFDYESVEDVSSHHGWHRDVLAEKTRLLSHVIIYHFSRVLIGSSSSTNFSSSQCSTRNALP